MKKKYFLLILSILCVSCNATIDTSSITSDALSDIISGIESTLSNDSNSEENTSSENISSATSVKKEFSTPSNVKIENDILSWNEVAEATNGYRVRINNESTVDVLNGTSLSILEHQDKLKLGINTFEVRTNGTDSFYISSYSDPISYLFGADEEKANAFIQKVNSIGDVNSDSYSAIEDAKDSYEKLEYADLLVPGVDEAYKTLVNKEGEYFLILVRSALSLTDSEFDAKKEEISNMYANLLDVNNENVLTALNIAFDYNVDTQCFTNENDQTVLYIYAYGFNIFGNKLTSVRPVVKQNNFELAVTGNDGIYQSIISDDVVIYYAENEVEQIKYLNLASGYVVGIIGDNNISFGYSGEESISKYKVYVFDDEDVDLSVAHTYSFKDMPLAVFETEYNPFMSSKIRNTLIENGFTGERNVRLAIQAIDENGNSSKLSLESIESKARTINLDGGLKLSSPIDVWNVTPSILENGDLDYKWEVISANSEFHEGYVDYLEFRLFNASLEFDGLNTETLAIIKKTSGGFITHDDIVSTLKTNGVYGDVSIKVAFRFVAKDGNGYESSDFVEFLGSHTYVIDNSLSTYGNIYIDENSGRLVWPWEIFMSNNAEADFVDHIEVYIFEENTEVPSIEASVGSFSINYPNDQFTYKEDIENKLFELGLKTGSYKFAAKLIAKDDSNYNDSNFYPLTSSYTYEVKELSEINIAKGKNTITSDSYLSQNGDSSNVVDGNTATGWRAVNSENDYVNTWVVIDLEDKYELSQVKVYWEAACPSNYEVYLTDVEITSDYVGDFNEFNKVVTGGNEFVGGTNPVDTFEMENAQGRYLIINCLEASSDYGNMLFEVEVYATSKIS